jgi:predicted RND superfamily exporter protein
MAGCSGSGNAVLNGLLRRLLMRVVVLMVLRLVLVLLLWMLHWRRRLWRVVIARSAIEHTCKCL